MTAMIVVLCVVLLLAAFLLLYRALLGPTVFDRILALNSLGTKTVVLIAAIGFLTSPSNFVDTSLVYALVNFVGTIAILKFVQFGRLG